MPSQSVFFDLPLLVVDFFSPVSSTPAQSKRTRTKINRNSYPRSETSGAGGGPRETESACTILKKQTILSLSQIFLYGYEVAGLEDSLVFQRKSKICVL